MSTLLLDDALKPATPTDRVIGKYIYHSVTDKNIAYIRLVKPVNNFNSYFILLTT